MLNTKTARTFLFFLGTIGIFHLPQNLNAMVPSRGMEHCLAHISAWPSENQSSISGFHHYTPDSCEQVSIPLSGSKKFIAVDRLTKTPNNVWIYKISENDRSDFVAYIIKDGIPHGPRTFFAPHETHETLCKRLAFEPEDIDFSGRAIRHFDGTSPDQSNTAVVYDIETGNPITAYPPIESFHFDGKQTESIADKLAEIQNARAQRPPVWTALYENNATNFQRELHTCSEQQQQDVLDWAATHDKWNFIEKLVEHNTLFATSALLRAIQHGNNNATETLLPYLDDKDAPLGPGKPTPLATACMLSVNDNAEYRNKRELIELLFKEGAGINTQDSQGRTALMYAARAGDADTVAWLIEHNADANLQDRIGKTAALFAHETQQFLKKRAASPTMLNNFAAVQACLNSPTHSSEKTKAQLKKKAKKTGASRSAPENKLITLNNLLVYTPAEAISKAHDHLQKFTHAEINNTPSTPDIIKQRLKNLELLIHHSLNSDAEKLALLCNSLLKKGLLSTNELMKMLAPENQPDAPIEINVVRAILQTADLGINTSDGGRYAMRLLSAYKNAPLLTLFLKKYELAHAQSHGKTLLRDAFEQCDDAEITTLFIALNEKISDTELTYAIKSGKAALLKDALQRQHPTWSPFKCMLQLGNAYFEQNKDETTHYCAEHQEELIDLLIDAIVNKNQRIFDALCGPICCAHTAIDTQGNTALMHLVQQHDRTLGTNHLFAELIQKVNPLQANARNQTALELNQLESENIKKLLHDTQKKTYLELRRLMLLPQPRPKDVDELLHLVTSSVLDANWIYEDGQSVLAYAIAYNHTDIVARILAQNPALKINYDQRQHTAPTPLCYAFVQRDEKLCQRLLKLGAQLAELEVCILEQAMTENIQHSYFFDLLDKADSSIFDNKTFPDQLRKIILFYAVVHNKTDLAHRILPSDTQLTLGLEFLSIAFGCAIENGNDQIIDLLMSPQISVTYANEHHDPAHILLRFVRSPDHPTEQESKKQDVLDSIKKHQKLIRALVENDNLSLQEATFLHAINARYQEPTSKTPGHVLYQLKRFPHLIERCPEIRNNLFVQATTKTKDLSLADFLADHGAGSGSPLTDLAIAISLSCPQRVRRLLEEHPELQAASTQAIPLDDSPGGEIASPLFAAFYRYSATQKTQTSRIDQARAVAAELFRCCSNPLQPMTIRHRDIQDNETRITPLDCLCLLIQKKLTTDEIDQFLRNANTNCSFDGDCLLKTCFVHAFIVTTATTVRQFSTDFSEEVHNYLGIIEWLCRNQDDPRHRLSNEDIISTCQLFYETWHGNFLEAYILAHMAEYEKVIDIFIDMLKQHTELHENDVIRWIIHDYKPYVTAMINKTEQTQ